MLHKTKGSDNFQTPPAALEELYPYVEGRYKPTDNSCMWDPCCGDGNIVRYFSNHGYKTVATDIQSGQNFLKLKEPYLKGFTFIVTNPPYSLKNSFIEHCYYFYSNYAVPFALLLPITAIETAARQRMYKRFGIELLLPKQRIAYETPSGRPSKPWFYSCWFTKGFGLNRDLTFME